MSAHSQSPLVKAAVVGGVLCTLAFPSAGLMAQTPDQTNRPPVPAITSAAPQAVKAPPSKLSRWLDIQAGTLAVRYRYVETSKSVVTASQMQFSGQFKPRFKFDPKGRLSVTAVFAPGNSFTGSWNTTGIGTGDWVRSWSMKQLYVAAVPAKGVEASFGSLGLVRGESTEITSYDNDGYIAGERLSVKRPKDLFFDELSVTSAYLGDTTKPALWDRWDGLTEGRNYFQYLAAKKINKTFSASADYTRYTGVGTFRAAVAAKTPKARIVDSLRYEHYVRGGTKSDSGFAVFADKNVTKRFTAGVGFANIDPNYGSLNADRFGKGKRIYETASFKVTQEFGFQLFMAQAVGNDYPVSNKYRFDVVASYNVLGAIQRAGHLK